MKKTLHLFKALALVFIAQLHPLSMAAQNALGCDGQRYVLDKFTDTTMTTVKFGSNFNVQYNPNFPAQEVDLFMDIVQPKGDTLSKRPVIVWAFGGGFIFGERKDMRPLCQAYAKKGYVCVTIDYRLWSAIAGGTPDSTKLTPVIIGAVHDMKAAVRLLRSTAANGNPYKIDVNNIIVGGISAGAITAMITAHMDSTDPITPEIRTVIANAGGFEGRTNTLTTSSAVKGVISMSGALPRREWINAGDPPFAACHGTNDPTVAYGYGKNVYGFYGDGDGTCAPYAASLGVSAVLVTVPGGGHTDIYNPTGPFASYAKLWLEKMTTFMHKLVCGLTPLPTQDIKNEALTFFPNPATNDMTLKFNQNTEGGQFDIEAFDAVGRSVLSLKNQSADGFRLGKSDVGGAGFYLVKMRFEGSENMIVKKVLFN
ncbi:MAG: alpha/beta hydrolase fold domain-containing protein [Saprospiraceae bacterium]|nr:alpha/beta hydrolase fold domain-containing protein [Saprospiraceae bacterium]